MFSSKALRRKLPPLDYPYLSQRNNSSVRVTPGQVIWMLSAGTIDEKNERWDGSNYVAPDRHLFPDTRVRNFFARYTPCW